jgi:hypothetical protein
VNDAAFSPDGLLVITNELTVQGSAETARIWRLFSTTEAGIDDGRSVIPRCLTRDQRERFFLDPEPPSWCIEMERWPYQGKDWKDWLRFKRANADPPVPNTPEWKAWIAVR